MKFVEANLAKDWVELFSNSIQINHSSVYLKQCIQKEHSWSKNNSKNYWIIKMIISKSPLELLLLVAEQILTNFQIWKAERL